MLLYTLISVAYIMNTTHYSHMAALLISCFCFCSWYNGAICYHSMSAKHCKSNYPI